jgi:hypothetical protein
MWEGDTLEERLPSPYDTRPATDWQVSADLVGLPVDARH